MKHKEEKMTEGKWVYEVFPNWWQAIVYVIIYEVLGLTYMHILFKSNFKLNYFMIWALIGYILFNYWFIRFLIKRSNKGIKQLVHNKTHLNEYFEIVIFALSVSLIILGLINLFYVKFPNRINSFITSEV